jgi:hypothetical protein
MSITVLGLHNYLFDTKKVKLFFTFFRVLKTDVLSRVLLGCGCTDVFSKRTKNKVENRGFFSDMNFCFMKLLFLRPR